MPLPPDTLTVHTREQADLLLDGTYARVLECTMQAHVSASEIARKTALPLKQVHHRLTKLVHAGLVTIIDERQRNGRAIKIYAAVAPAYRIPVELTEAADLEEAMLRLTGPEWRRLCKASAQVFRDEQGMEFQYLLDRTGSLNQNLNPAGFFQEPLKPTYGALYTTVVAMLTPDTFTEAERRLRDLMTWLRDRMKEEQHDPRASPAIVTLAIVPAGEDR